MVHIRKRALAQHPRLYFVSDRLNACIPDICKFEVGFGKVSFETCLRIRILIKRKCDFHTSGLKTTTCATASGKEVVHLNSHRNATEFACPPQHGENLISALKTCPQQEVGNGYGAPTST